MPMMTAPAPAATQATAPPPLPAIEITRALVVASEPARRAFLTRLLPDWSPGRVLTAGTPDDAFALAEDADLACILICADHPDHSKLETCRLVDKAPGVRKIPVIALLSPPETGGPIRIVVFCNDNFISLVCADESRLAEWIGRVLSQRRVI